MEEKKFDKLMRDAFSWTNSQREKGNDLKGKVKAEKCFSEETLSDYLASRLPAAEREEVEEHLSFCSDCRQLSITLIRVEMRSKIWRVALAWVKGQLVSLQADADPFSFQNGPEPVLVRGHSPQSETYSMPSFSKIIHGYRITAQIEGEEGICELYLDVSPPAGQSLGPGMRVDLYRADRIRRSYSMEEGAVRISAISPGEYEIKVRGGSHLIALLSLSIKDTD
ncbi:MAG: zf-HC2 domain-containing protein [bacterium]